MKGYNFPAAMFLLELRLQCSLAKHSFAHLTEGTRGWQKGVSSEVFQAAAPPLELISRVTSFLSAVAMASKILFGASEEPPVKQRCERLRQLLSLDATAPPNTSSRATRNSIEHLDERLDGCLLGFEQGAISLVIHATEDPPAPGTFVSRLLHPRTLVFQSAGDVLDLPACMAELDLVQGRIKAALERLHNGPPFQLWDAEHVTSESPQSEA